MTFKHSSIALGVVTALLGTTELKADEFEKSDEVIVVSGSRVEQKLSDLAGSVSVVTEQALEEEVSIDLASAFRYQTGITTHGSAGNAQAMTIRGIGGNRVVYIKDGRRMNDAYEGGQGLLVGRGYLDVEGVKQIEVAKGAASSLYGSDALGGIVVITTKSPTDYLAGEQSFGQLSVVYHGASSEQSLSGVFATKVGEHAASMQLTRRDGKETQNYDDNLPGYEYTSTAAILKGEFVLDEQSILLGTVDFFEQDTEQVLVANAHETQDMNDSLAVSLAFQTSASTPLYNTLEAQVYFSDYEQTSDQVRAGADRSGLYVDTNDYRFEQQIFGTRLVLAKQLNAGNIQHQLIYGVDLDSYETRRPRFKTRRDMQGALIKEHEAQKAFPGADTRLIGVFIQDNVTLVPEKISLNAGLRFDSYRMEPKQDVLYKDAQFDDISETALSPKVGLVYSLTENLNIVGQYARGFKIPPHDQAYQSHGVEPFYQIIPNTDLDPEYSDSVELGLKGSFENSQFSIALFHSKFDDFINNKLVRTEPTFIPNVEKQIYQYQNIEEVKIKGLEANMTLWLNEYVALDSGVTYLYGKDEQTDEYISSLSPLNGFIKARYESENWSVTAAMRAASKMTKVPADAIETAGWATVDVFSDYQWKNWKLNAGIFNLFDKEYVNYERIASNPVDSNMSQYTMPGRHLAVKLKMTF
ncbi:MULTISPECIES: TonB-dependent hemoglobin/transferrin/lactoferrin family receptor [unclassified Pseudoalteromonas]|uniref:TonB-dependent hemoglobin/transferrin/lactoferrin family receptor n=1 Tax=unclassified Pseudoalteromonas TaxID=194690 RepID=UPI0020985C4A|nr:TonB-dependent hemoglobin/transferrin/lactoferrin family receptor [Pseudoalteromonas sp. XMcav2-N]MCO7186999.1 TonB-dependent hemoglobin/transferrin/lactoferrin family receptor [Pseudoalteromonas sp. XMcav2-N]